MSAFNGDTMLNTSSPHTWGHGTQSSQPLGAPEMDMEWTIIREMSTMAEVFYKPMIGRLESIT